MSFKSLHNVEKPRERLQKGGPQALKDEELLAILLRTGYSGKNVLELSRELLKKYPDGSLGQAGLESLSQVKGMRGTRASTLVAAFELARRFQNSVSDLRPILNTPAKVLDQLTFLRSRKKEHLVALYLTGRHQLIEQEVVSIGTLSSSLVHPREVFAPALEQRAAAVVVAHNHPSGDPSPSREDQEVTARLIKAGRLLGIELLDHIIVADSSYFSFKEKGFLKDSG
ncbi:MAG: DNA repair protein RadC [Elusimicrobia bacterium]|nr:DNA repair protein RadC [Elusimicrobiota bacterium]